MLSSVALADNPHKAINNFNAGELTPLLSAREDLAKYQNGCLVMENMIPYPQGGARKRPGTKFIAEVKSSTLKTRLIPFEFSTSQSYVVEAGNQYVRFYTDDAQILDGSGTENISALDNIVAHWLLNEIIGTDIVDDDGATHDGVSTVDASVLTATGKVGTGSFDLDGQYTVEVADAAALSFTDDADDSAFSIIGWAHVNKEGGIQNILSKWRTGSSTREWRFSLSDQQKLQLHLADSSVNLASNAVGQWKLNDDAADTNVVASAPQFTIDAVSTGANTFTITGDGDLSTSFLDSSEFTVEGSTGNDGQYVVVSTTFAGDPDFVITVASVTNATADGTIAPHAGVASVNTSTINATGQISGALDFGGSAYVTVDHSTQFTFGDATNDSAFSASAWVFVTATTGIQSIVGKWETVKQEWVFYIDAEEKLSLLLKDVSVPKNSGKATDAALSNGWHFVTATYDGTGGSTADTGMTLYVDGESVSATGVTLSGYVAMESADGDVMIGAVIPSSPTNFFADKIDNVVVFDIELTAGQVRSLYNDGVGIETLSNTMPVPFAVSDNALSEGWRFVGCTYSAPADATTAADGIILYVDAAAVSSTATNDATYTSMQGNTEEVRIGAQRDSADSVNENFYKDKLDEISLYSDVLTPTEIASLFATTPYEVSTPYLTADLFNLKFKQSADVLYITHPDYETRKLSRVNNSLWEIPVFGTETGPFITQNRDVAKTITASGTTGTVTLTATGHTPFVLGDTAGHLPSGTSETSKSQTGALFRLVHPIETLEFKEELESDFAAGQVEDTSWVDCGILYKGATWTLVSGDTWFGTIKVQRNYTIGAAVGNGADEGASVGWETVFTFSSGAGAAVDARNVSTTGTEDEDAAQYRVIYADETGVDTVSVYFSTDQTEHIGIVKITGITSTTVATGTVLTTLASTTATHRWSEGSWSNFRGWPRTVAFFEDRLIFGGNTSQPDTIWGSVTGDYQNMTEGINDDDAVEFTLTSRQVNVIEWLIGKDKILIGTSGAEWTIEGGTAEPLTPTNVVAKQQSTYGSDNQQSTLANESVLFFQRGGEKMRELAYNWELDSYVAPDMTILANLVTDGGINEAAFQKTPDSILWCIRDDGELPVFSYERAENITAWSRMITHTNLAGTLTDSDFESVTVINGSPEDEVWAIVERTIGGATKRYVEQFQPRDFGSDADDAYYVDCGVTYDSTASSAMTGLDHLNGQTVYVLADGVIFDTEVVAGGAITLSLDDVTTTASTVQMGLGYEAQMQTMALNWLGGETIQGRQKRISEVMTQWYISGDFSVGRDASTLRTYSISGQTTDIDRITFPPGYDRNAHVYVFQLSPEPLTVLSIIMEFSLR